MFPTPHSVTYTPFTGMGEDPRTGNDVPVYGAAIDLPVYSWSSVRARSTDGHTSRVEWDIDLAMPNRSVNGLDKFTLDGQDYTVAGVRDMTKGWHGWKPGIVVELVAANG